jgi:two-component system NtrC family sensor kinase
VNASQAMGQTGTVTIRSAFRDGRLTVQVSDTGCGMTKEVMERIFEPFFTTKGAEQGTGLGLSISQDIVKKHGGLITVESQAGKGTTFTVSLPA